MKIPAKVLENVQQNQALEIEWAGHRDIYEVVEEWTDGLFWFINVWIAAWFLYYFFELDFDILLAISLFFSLVALLPMGFETLKWFNEWHIVTQDSHKGGGALFQSRRYS